MKKLSFLIIITIFASFAVYAQHSTYFDAPFGGGGGYTPGWFVPKTSEVNSQLQKLGIPSLTTGGFYTSGGAGFIYLGFIPHVRIGGMGFSGSTSESALANGTNREVKYSMGGGGLTLEYTLPFIRNVAVSVGAVIGGGSLQIEVYNNSGNFNWNNVWDDANNGSTKNVHKTIQNNYWIFSPTLNVDIPFYRFISFRFGIGYQLSLSESWTVDNQKELSGVPSGLNGNSFFIQTGIFVGLFSY